jgi:hypothetical protein
MTNYQVIAGNVGLVYDGGFYDSANDAFHVYRKRSMDGVGRASGEDVTMMKDGEIIREFSGSSSEDEA